MPEDIPKAVLVLTWLLSGVIVFGYLLWQGYLYESFAFAIVFYTVPVVLYRKFGKKQGPGNNADI